MKFTFIVFAIIAIYVYSTSKVVVPEGKRAVVLNLAKFDRVLSVGTHFRVPYAERAVLFELDRYIPEWKTLSNDEINLKVKEIFLSSPSKF